MAARSLRSGPFLPGKLLPDRLRIYRLVLDPRVCIGAQFALTEATLGLATMIQAFRIERTDDTPVIPWAVITTQPDQPASVLAETTS